MQKLKNTFPLMLTFVIMLTAWSLFGAKPDSSQEKNAVSPRVEIDRIIVKFADQYHVRMQGNSLKSVNANPNYLQQAISSANGNQIVPLFAGNQQEIDMEKASLENEKSISLPDLNSYYQIHTEDYATAMQIIDDLNKNPLVEKAYIRPKSYPAAYDIPPTTPDFTPLQGYLEPAPGGVDAYYAWNVPGGNGENVHVIDIEGNWNFDHEDFGDNIDTLLFGLPVNLPGWSSHGSCVIGIIGADSNSYGITGIAHKATVSTVSIGGIGVATAVGLAASQLSAGDVILIELNSPGPRYNFEFMADQSGYVPEEYFDETFDAVQYASAKGITVCAVAGNGYENLDDPIYENKFNASFRNSHAIIVGAGAPPSGNWGQDRSRLYYSNYGSRVNLQGWGKEVAASGYGVLFDGDGDYRQHYTDRFNGTSSATAMITGVVASLQSAYMEAFGQPMPPDDLAYLLDISGTLQPNPNEKIGPRPDLKLALQSMPPPIQVKASPGFVDYTMAAGSTGQTSVFLLNNYSNRTIGYNIQFDETIEGWETGGWLQISPLSGTVLPNDATILDFNFDGTEMPGSLRPYKANVYIEVSMNPGLDTIFIPVILNMECNDTSYSVFDSDYGQVPYEWIDITSLGNVIPETSYYNADIPTNALDDGTAGPLSLGFSFNFYNQYFNKIYISTNGAISFTEDELVLDGYYDDVYFPKPGFNTFLSPFWNDLSLDESYHGHGDIYYYNSPANDTFIVSYEKIGNLVEAGDTTITFQIILTADGNIRYQYKDIGIGGAAATALVGFTINQDCRYVKFFDRLQSTQNMPHDEQAVEFRPNFESIYQIGDANNDGSINVSDAVYIINYVFIGGAPPLPLEAGNANCDGSVNVSDAVYIINYIFIGGYAPGDIDGDGITDC